MIQPITAEDTSARLLDPCVDAWGAHFLVEDDRLVPRPGDADATYTHRAYDIDHERKRALRGDRREAITEALRDLDARSPLVDRLISCAEAVADHARREAILEAARNLRIALRRTLRRYAAVPADAPGTCRCGDAVERRLPAWLAAQTRDFPVG